MSTSEQARLDAWQQRQAQALGSFAPVSMRGRIQRVNGMLPAVPAASGAYR